MVKKMLNPVIMATVVMIIYIIMPIMSVFVSTYLSTYAYMLMCVALFSFIMLAGGMSRFTSMIYLIFPVGVYVFCTFFVKNESVVILGYQGLLLLLTVAAGYYFTYYRDDAVPLFAKVIVFALVITVITTIIGLLRFPEASRILATIATSDDPRMLEYSWNNIGGYEFVYNCVLLYPVLMLAYKHRKISRAAFLILFILMFSLVILAEYTIALLLTIISSTLYFASKKTTTNQLMMIGIILIFLFLLFQSVIQNFFLWLSDTLGSEVFAERLTALAGGVEGIENSESNRVELYRMSIRAFLASPVFGNMSGKHIVPGGHSFILDTLADYGIIGGLAITVMYRNVYRFFFAPFKNKPGYGFVLWTFIQTVFLSIVNTGAWLHISALSAPIILSLIYKTYNEDRYETSLDY
ncbi:MAG: hypothetical protein J6T73_05960 [Clostridia bacterium]|nr:hypothetical protein [Clostridia bacterium]